MQIRFDKVQKLKEEIMSKLFDVFSASMKKIGDCFVNEKKYFCKNIRIISNGSVIIDDNVVDSVVGPVSVNITGDCDSIMNTSGNVVINGNVTGDADTVSGNIICENVGRNVETTSGEIDIKGKVCGDVETVSGDITCGDIGGSVETLSGDIRRK